MKANLDQEKAMSIANINSVTDSRVKWTPRKSIFKKTIVKIVFFVLGRGLQSASKHDATIQQEVATWPENTLVLFKVIPDSPRMAFQKTAAGRLHYLGTQVPDEQATITVAFKNIECAFLMLTAQVGTAQAYSEHRMAVRGDLVLALSIIRCLNVIERYLFPSFIARGILRRMPNIPFWRRHGLRLWIYVFGIAFGI
jgi:hypothetical protein